MKKATKLLTTGEAAKILSMTPAAIRYACDHRRLYHERKRVPGSHRRIPPIYLHAWAEYEEEQKARSD